MCQRLKEIRIISGVDTMYLRVQPKLIFIISFTFTYMTVFSSLKIAPNIAACLRTFTSCEAVISKGVLLL
jgi:hypothetical protein